MQNSADAVGPQDSTTDLSNPDGAGLANTINLTQEQLKDIGIAEPQIGDEYHITIKVEDNSDGLTAMILDGSAVKTPEGGAQDEQDDAAEGENEEDTEETPENEDASQTLAVKAANPPPKKKPKQRVLTPDEMGISTTSGL